MAIRGERRTQTRASRPQQTHERDSRRLAVARALAAHQHGAAAGAIALMVLVFLWPALVHGHVLGAFTSLYQEPPWTDLLRPGTEQDWHLDLSDFPISYYPWAVLARDMIHAGTFPAWNPYALTGTPFFANYEIGWASPFNLPLWALPLHRGLGLSAALKLWTAGFGTYLLARELRLGFWPAIAAAASFALCAFNLIWLSYGPFVVAAAMLPWAILFVERIVTRGDRLSGPALAGVMALVLTAGHPGTAVHVIGATALYALLRAGALLDVPPRERVRRLALLLPALVIGALMAAVVLLPAQQAAEGAAGTLARRDGGQEFFAGSHLPTSTLRTLLFPDWWGRPSELFMGGPVHYSERTFFAGGLALLLACVGLARTSWRRTAPFAVLAVLALLVTVRTPGVFDAIVQLPGFDQVQNQRVALVAQFAIALLAGFGLQAIVAAPQRLRRAWIVVGAGAAAGLLALLTLQQTGGAWGTAVEQFLARQLDQTAPAASLALASIGWWLVPVALLAAGLLVLRRRPAAATSVGAVLALAVVLEMLHFGHGFEPIAPAERVIPQRTPAVAFLQRHRDDGRIAGLGGALSTDFSTVFRLHDARGYDAPQPSLRFHRMWKLLAPEQAMHTVHTFYDLPPHAAQVLGALGVRYLVVPPGSQASDGPLVTAFEGTDANVFENALAAPRAYVARQVHVVDDESEELAALAASGFDPRRQAIVRRDELGDAQLATSDGSGRVRITEERNARVTMRATLARPGLVVLSDAWAPGWSVEIDGRRAPALQTDVVLRGTVVPAGTHEVVWRYTVPGLRLGIALSVLGGVLLVAWIGAIVRGRRGHRS